MEQHRGGILGAVADQTFLFMIIKNHSHAFVLCANKLIVNMQNAGNGKMMTRTAILSFRVWLYHCALSLSLAFSLHPSLPCEQTQLTRGVTFGNSPKHTHSTAHLHALLLWRDEEWWTCPENTHTYMYCTCTVFNRRSSLCSQTPHKPLFTGRVLWIGILLVRCIFFRFKAFFPITFF